MKFIKRLFYLLAIALLAVGCDELFDPTLRPTPDPELGEEFKAMEHWIDMSQTNKFNESLFCNEWTLSKVTMETYVDGVLTETEDRKVSTKELSIKKDYTVTIKNSTLKGIWLYSHNTIMWKLNNGSYYSYEVVEAKTDALSLKEEDLPVGGPVTPYFKDKSGKHRFFVYEYTPKSGK
jgi:hypothetical protein